jgi:hypothetical protein
MIAETTMHETAPEARPAITRPPDRRDWLLAAARFCLLAATADQETAAKALKALAEDATRASEGAANER